MNWMPQIILDGKAYDAQAAKELGLELTQIVQLGEEEAFYTLSLTNRSDRAIHLDKFNWRREGDHGDLLNTPDLRLYLEGWQMASPCGVRKPGDCDFRYDPWYIGYAVAEPQDYIDQPNHFRAENMLMFHNPESGETLLVGFVTAAKQFGHMKVVLGEKGVETLDVRSACDGILVEPGETVSSEVLAVMRGTDGFALQQRWAACLGERMQARTHMAPPVGWCSWYYYFANVTQQDIERNVDFLVQNRERFPLRYIQLDDGYQSALGDWLTCNEKFPDGLAHVARAVREGGFIPALWLAPFLVEENAQLLREHPEWMIHDEQGEVILQYPWRGHMAAVLDATHPEVQAHLKQLFAQIRALGFDYVKLDFLVVASAVRGGVLHDPKATRAQNLRLGMEAIREGFGEDGFILGCTVPFGPVIGLVDGERISTDITPYWVPDRKWYDEAPTVPNVCRNVIRHLYMDKRLWNNDPDTLIVRDDNTKLTETEMLVWYHLVRLAGGMLMLSDNFLTLTPERSRLVEELLRDPNAFETQPIDFWNEGIPSALCAIHKQSGKRVLARFNFADEPANGLAPHSCRIEEDK